MWFHAEKSLAVVAGSHCPAATSNRKVRITGVPDLDSGAVTEAPLNQRLKNLIQQLGEAIHESVAESEQIAGVVQDIRRQGFDVLLMLEATIGLNEVEQEPETDAQGNQLEQHDGPFTAQDVNFLRSLRISVEGEAKLDE